jgi:hypothetical protein
MTGFSRRDRAKGGMALAGGTLVRPQSWFLVTPMWGPRDGRSALQFRSSGSTGNGWNSIPSSCSSLA